MPELPEVEVVRRGLDGHVRDRTITAAAVLHPRSVRRHLPGPEDFCERVPGQAVVTARRRGKYLWLALDSDDAVLAHLGMSGQLLVVPRSAPAGAHLRVVLELDGGFDVRFVDQRMFGGMLISAGGAELPAEIAHIALDPLDPRFDDGAFTAALRRRRSGVKRALLDQTLISGVGNIYADEALWGARLHYARPTATLRQREVAVLLRELRHVLGRALDQGGTSFDALYVDVNGNSGYFSRSLAVYGRAGEPCLRCGATVRRDAFMNRSSYTCPNCQRRPRNAHP